MSFKTQDGRLHDTIESAQRDELKSFIDSKFTPEDSESNAYGILDVIMSNKEAIIDILTMTASSKPKARKANGGTKKRSPKKSATGELSESEMAEVENLN